MRECIWIGLIDPIIVTKVDIILESRFWVKLNYIKLTSKIRPACFGHVSRWCRISTRIHAQDIHNFGMKFVFLFCNQWFEILNCNLDCDLGYQCSHFPLHSLSCWLTVNFLSCSWSYPTCISKLYIDVGNKCDDSFMDCSCHGRKWCMLNFCSYVKQLLHFSHLLLIFTCSWFGYWYHQGDKARVIQTLLFVAGVNTLLQTLFGTRLPTVVGGGSSAYIYPIAYIITDSSLQQISDPNEVSFVIPFLHHC